MNSHELRLWDLIKDKNVLLVGNSNTLLKKDNSELINSYEFVVRFNLSIQHYHKYSSLGTKCDAWIYAMSHTKRIIDVWNKSQAKPLHCIRYGPEKMQIGPYKYFINSNLVKSTLRKELELPKSKHPTTGIATIWYFLNKTSAKSISLIGFDSFKSVNFYTRKNGSEQWHNYNSEREWIYNKVKEKKINLI